MKRKKNIYFLVATVIIVWGILGYKLLTGFNVSAKKSDTVVPTHFKASKPDKKPETFNIKNDYRDPFLGLLENKNIGNPKPKMIPQVKKEMIPFPIVVYVGFIEPKGKNEKVFLVAINGQQHIFKINTLINEVKLLSGNSQEITVQFQHQKKSFQLEK